MRLNGMSQILIEPTGWWKGFNGFWGLRRRRDSQPRRDASRPDQGVPRASDHAGADPLRRHHRFGCGVGRRRAARSRRRHQPWPKRRPSLLFGEAGAGLPARRRLPRSRQPILEVALDPTWSPNGSTLAFIEAPNYAGAGTALPLLHHWYADHRLFLYDVQTQTLRGRPIPNGASVPQWSADGRSLLCLPQQPLDPSHARRQTG